MRCLNENKRKQQLNQNTGHWILCYFEFIFVLSTAISILLKKTLRKHPRAPHYLKLSVSRVPGFGPGPVRFLK